MRGTRRCIGIERSRAAFAHQLKVISTGEANKYARGTASDLAGRNASVLDCLPGDLEQQALLRVHSARLARRNSKEMRIEAVNLRNEATKAGIHFARCVRVGVVVVGDFPTIIRYL